MLLRFWPAQDFNITQRRFLGLLNENDFFSFRSRQCRRMIV
jgi:hypothetical protein